MKNRKMSNRVLLLPALVLIGTVVFATMVSLESHRVTDGDTSHLWDKSLTSVHEIEPSHSGSDQSQ